jgi:Zn-dependent protease
VWRSGSLRIGRIAGIAIDIHITFLLTIAWGAWQGWTQYGNIPGALYGIIAILLLFVCVLLHELGHSFQARSYGLVVRGITLLPVGGLAQLERGARPPPPPQLV